jgi:hypothetical protein
VSSTWFKIDSALPGDVTIAAGQPNRQAGLTSLLIIPAAAVGVQWKSINPGVSTVNLSGSMTIGGTGNGYELPLAPGGARGELPGAYIMAQPGDNLVLTLGSGSIQVSGHGTYSLFPV